VAKEIPEKKNHDDLIATAKKRFAIAEECEKDIRQKALEDWKFRAGEQWPEAIRRERENDGRPVLVINKVLQNIRHVTNDQRQNRPSIKVHPVDDHADIDTARIYQGMVRHIEQDSGADVAYDTAFEGAAIGGFGYLRVYTEYVDPTSFDQQIRIGHIENPFSVYFDPNAKNPDGSDANWAFIVEDVPEDDYKSEFKDSELASNAHWDMVGNENDWVQKDSVRIAEYFYKEFKNVTVVQLFNGQVVEESELESALAQLFPQGLEIDPSQIVVNKKKAKVPIIKWCKLNGLEVLEETEWPGRWIPVIPVYGDKLVIEGKRILEGIVRHAKDSQRMYNYFKSSETEAIALAPKAPYMVAEGQIPKAYQGMWKAANKKSYPYLVYSPKTHEGQLVPPPQRNFGEAPTQAITQAAMMAGDDIKGTTGVYDGAMGAPSNETSGRAILARGAQAQTSNFHFIDNLTRSIRHTGRIIIDLIPKIYDTARTARILGEEGDEEVVRINEEFIYKGQRVHYKMGVGKYDVSVQTGPSFATKRQEAAASMLDLSKAAPQLMQVAGDLMVKNMDWPGAQEISERLKKTLPPGIADDKDQPQVPPEMQAQMQQSIQMIEMLTTQLNEANDKIKTKSIEIESKERLEAMKLENDILLEKMKAELQLKLKNMELADSATRFQVDQQLRELQSAQEREDAQLQNISLSPDQAQDPQLTGEFSPGSNMEGF
jgi:hypothetical protein